MFSDEFVKLWDDLKANLILKMDLCHSKQIYKAYCFLAFVTNYGKKVARCRTFLTRKQTLWLINPTATKISRTKKTGNRFAMAKCVRNIHGIMQILSKDPGCLPAPLFKVRLSPSRNVCVICFIESPSQMMKNVFYFISKGLFVVKIFKFLPWSFGHVGKTT